MLLKCQTHIRKSVIKGRIANLQTIEYKGNNITSFTCSGFRINSLKHWKQLIIRFKEKDRKMENIFVENMET